jgi:hypothetical protein
MPVEMRSVDLFAVQEMLPVGEKLSVLLLTMKLSVHVLQVSRETLKSHVLQLIAHLILTVLEIRLATMDCV